MRELIARLEEAWSAEARAAAEVARQRNSRSHKDRLLHQADAFDRRGAHNLRKRRTHAHPEVPERTRWEARSKKDLAHDRKVHGIQKGRAGKEGGTYDSAAGDVRQIERKWGDKLDPDSTVLSRLAKKLKRAAGMGGKR